MADNGLFEPSAGMPAAWPDNRLLAAPPSMADAYDYHAQALQKWMAEQRASGVAAGTNDPETGWPTQKGIVDAIGQAAQGVMLGTTAPGRPFYHFTDQTFTKFGGKSRGAVYLADTPEQATAGGLSGMRERMSSPDEARGPVRADQVPGGKVLTVTVPHDMPIYGDSLSAQMTNAQRDAALGQADTIAHSDPAVAQRAKELASRITGRSSSTSIEDSKWVDSLLDKYGDGAGMEANMTPAERTRYGSIVHTMGAFRHLSDAEFENPTTQSALKLLGYQGARVKDEGGVSLAVMDPSRLSIGKEQQ